MDDFFDYPIMSFLGKLRFTDKVLASTGWLGSCFSDEMIFHLPENSLWQIALYRSLFNKINYLAIEQQYDVF